ncbi:MAG: hypothetical protein L6V93_11050 [Clostridiales bacterium]|nr:MAG: hypothetical protein L6V93_11050 [Clostridiales bacterium]
MINFTASSDSEKTAFDALLSFRNALLGEIKREKNIKADVFRRSKARRCTELTINSVPDLL